MVFDECCSPHPWVVTCWIRNTWSMSHQESNCDCNICSDYDLWNQIKSRAAQLPATERTEWERLLASLKQRDEMTLNALKLAESGLRMMASRMNKMEQQKSQSQRLFRQDLSGRNGQAMRIDPSPGSDGCMWISWNDLTYFQKNTCCWLFVSHVALRSILLHGWPLLW